MLSGSEHNRHADKSGNTVDAASVELSGDEKPGLKVFAILLLGGGISLFGSALTGFALGIWAYQQHGQVSDFAYIATAAALPRALLSPFAGALVDRWNRKAILIMGQIAHFSATLLIAILYWNDALEIWHMVVLNLIGSSISSVVLPTLSASISNIVPKRDIQRANGMAGLMLGFIHLLSPMISATLLVSIGLEKIIIIDLMTFASALFVLTIVPIPQPVKSASVKYADGDSIFSDMKFGWRFLFERRGLFWLTCFNSVIGLGMIWMGVLMTPIVLGFSDAKALGMIMTVGGFGMMVGSAAVIITGGAKRRVYAVLATATVACMSMIVTPVFTNVWLVAAGGFLCMASFPLGAAASQSIFQHKVPADVQGRIFGLRNFLTGITGPLSLPLIGPIADRYFMPLLLEGGALADSLGWLYGTGDGRGVAFMTSILGALLLAVVFLACVNSHLRRVDIDLPDYLDDNPKK